MLHRPVRINKGLLALAALATVFLLGTPQSARASLAIFLQEDAGPVVMVGGPAADFTSVSFTGTFGPTGIGGTDFKVTIQGASSDNGPSTSDLLSSANAIENISGATHTLHVWASQTNYSLPTGTPLSVESGLGGSMTTPTITLTNIFQTWNNNSNGLRDIVGASSTGLQTALGMGTTFDTGSAFGSFPRTTATSLYSMTQEANIQLTAGGKINFSAHEIKSVPEPATIAMAVSGLPILGLLWARRRRARA